MLSLAALLPKDADELLQFTVIVSAGYISLSVLVWAGRRMKGTITSDIDYVARLFDAATFTTSSLMLASIFEKSIIPLLGDLRYFLFIAGMAGLMYSVRALFKA